MHSLRGLIHVHGYSSYQFLCPPLLDTVYSVLFTSSPMPRTGPLYLITVALCCLSFLFGLNGKSCNVNHSLNTLVWI